MSANTYQNIKLFLIVFIASAFVLGFISYANGQAATTTTQKVAEVQEQVAANNVQLDATTGTTLGAIGIGGIALAREFFNTRKLKKEDRATDKDTGNSLIIMYRLVQAMEVYVPGMKEALDQPFNTDTMQKDVTIRKKYSGDIQGWADYMMQVLQAFPPSMTPAATISIPSASADLNIQTKEAAKVEPQKPTPPVTGNTTPASSSSTTNTSTVGK